MLKPSFNFVVKHYNWYKKYFRCIRIGANIIRIELELCFNSVNMIYYRCTSFIKFYTWILCSPVEETKQYLYIFTYMTWMIRMMVSNFGLAFLETSPWWEKNENMRCIQNIQKTNETKKNNNKKKKYVYFYYLETTTYRSSAYK